jgi:hypothetical protein
LVDSLLDGADAGDMTQLATAVLTVLIAAWLLWRHPGHSRNVTYSFQIPLVRLSTYGWRLWMRRAAGGDSSRRITSLPKV